MVELSSSLAKEHLSMISTKAELENAEEGKSLAWGLWVGNFERKLERMGSKFSSLAYTVKIENF